MPQQGPDCRAQVKGFLCQRDRQGLPFGAGTKLDALVHDQVACCPQDQPDEDQNQQHFHRWFLPPEGASLTQCRQPPILHHAVNTQNLDPRTSTLH
jgi:hypothetical protein